MREDRLWWVRHTAENYDLDGVDLNFFRMPWYFKPGEEEAGAPLMNDLIRSGSPDCQESVGVTSTADAAGGQGSGYGLEACRRIGLDVETWLRQGWVDRMLIGGGYTVFTNPAQELVKLGHGHNVPVYPCINCGLGVFGSDEAMRGAASNIFSGWSRRDLPLELPVPQGAHAGLRPAGPRGL